MNWQKIRQILDERTSINSETGCWEYQRTNSEGYGQITIDGIFYYVHRLSIMLKLEVTDLMNFHILHKCNNRCCWNPEHLYVGTNQDNIADKVESKTGRGRYSDVTHCVNGHEFTEQNTYWSKRASGEMRRQCRECRAIKDRERKMRLKMVKAS